MGNRARGLQRRRRRLAVLSFRRRALTRVPLERGRPGGLCDREQRLCFALSFWNGRDPILKERIFGLSGPEGNHGKDAKEYWWSLDATPTYSWLRWRYHYPQAEFPYARLRQENANRTCEQPEFELLDTGVFDDNRYWQITADYAKAGPDDVLIRIAADVPPVCHPAITRVLG